MKSPRSKTGLVFCSLYLGLYLLSGIYSVVYLLIGQSMSEFNPPGVAALPWTVFLIPVYRWMGVGNVYQRLIAEPALYGLFMWAILLPGAILNAVLLYLCGRSLSRGWDAESDNPETATRKRKRHQG